MATVRGSAVKQAIIDEILDEGVIINAVVRATAGLNSNGHASRSNVIIEAIGRDGPSLQFKVVGDDGPRYFKVRVTEAY